MMPISTKGVLGHFYEPADALAAAAKVRDAGWKHFDFLTPFPIHGMEEAMGQKRSWIPVRDGRPRGVRNPLRAGPPELRDGLGLADELRRQAVRGVAGVHPDHLRGDGVLGRARQRGHRGHRGEEGHDSAAAAAPREDRRDVRPVRALDLRDRPEVERRRRRALRPVAGRRRRAGSSGTRCGREERDGKQRALVIRRPRTRRSWRSPCSCPPATSACRRGGRRTAKATAST